MLALLLFSVGYLFKGLIAYCLEAALAVAGLVVLMEFWRGRRHSATPGAPSKSSGCTMMLVFVVGLLLLIWLLFMWQAATLSPAP
ncbi:hypothetical protein EJV47_18690 [Hymenobacter gummosus]|uniref:Uncharacterized protein n=1 Tax=Hymenobacter gummosus TaxID=1776032 RepID=A0A431TYL4_9BACT|nr:hypothetical protein [Hymenobacter gummosus]RTQ47454.1 hypothetical protein EJV47_18690 [Hymenobacter gummosus]